MKTIILSTLALCIALTSNAQTIERNVISSAGKTSTVNNVTLGSTVGETFTNTLSTANNSITQGFQKGNLIVARVANDVTDETSAERTTVNAYQGLSLNVFPNPTTDYVNIVAENETEPLNLVVTDIQGMVVQQLKYKSQQVQVDFTKLNPGTYFIVATNESGTLRNTYKVIKQK